MKTCIGSNIRKIRELKNISQEYMADKLGVSQSTYSAIENCRTKLKDERLLKIAELLQVEKTTISNFNIEKVIPKADTEAETLKAFYDYLISVQDEQIRVLKEIISKYHSRPDKD